MGCGIDVGRSAVKMVQLRRTLRGWRLTGVARRRPAPAESLAALLKGMRDGRTESVPSVMGFTGRDLHLQAVPQPAMKRLNYRIMMKYEIDQRKETGPDRYVDFCTLREPDAYYPQYLAMVGVASKEGVEQMRDGASRAGFDVRDVVPNGFALFACYQDCVPEEGGTSMLLDLGSENMDMVLVRGGKMIYARNVSTGSSAFDQNIAGLLGVPADKAEALKLRYGTLMGGEDEDEESPEAGVRPALRTAVGQLVGVIQSSINFARTQLGETDLSVDRIHLSGGGGRLKGLPEYLRSALKMEVDFLDPFADVEIGEDAVAAGAEERPSDLAVACGLARLAAAPGGRTRLSLAPDDLRQRRDFFQRKVFMIASVVLLAIGMTVATGAALSKKWSAENELQEFVRQNEKVAAEVKEFNEAEEGMQEVAGKAALLRSHYWAGRAVLDGLGRLSRVIPKGVAVRRIQFSGVEEARSWGPSASGGESEYCIINDPARGTLLGRIVEEEGGEIFLAGEEEPVLPGNFLHRRWFAPSIRISVTGEIDESVPGGVRKAFEKIEEALRDRTQGIEAGLVSQRAIPGRPGWRTFEFRIELP